MIQEATRFDLEGRASMSRSYAVTGGGRGIGRALVERLLKDTDDNAVVAIELDPAALDWTDQHPAGPRAISVIGDAADETVTERAADLAQEAGTLAGWVNNAAVFRDASIHMDGPSEVLDVISLNLDPAVVGCATAIRRFLAAGTGGAIVNVSSHQAQRAVRGALPYATAKAAVEGLTRALAVDYGSQGIRVNAVALGSITTERYEEYLARQKPAARPSASRKRCACCIRSAGWGFPRRWRSPSRTCSQKTRASSTARSCPLTAVGRRSDADPEEA
jgi:NAD(P)-dependent dehydrogenase (short-subunit alcohol dehydrogenase family)